MLLFGLGVLVWLEEFSTINILLFSYMRVSHAWTTYCLLGLVSCYFADVLVEFFIQIIIELWKISTISYLNGCLLWLGISWLHLLLYLLSILIGISTSFRVISRSECRLWIKFILFYHFWEFRWSLWWSSTSTLVVLYLWAIVSIYIGCNNMAIIHLSNHYLWLVIITALILCFLDIYLVLVDWWSCWIGINIRRMPRMSGKYIKVVIVDAINHFKKLFFFSWT